MKCAGLQRKIMSLTPTPCGVELKVKYHKSYLLWIAWNVQICTEIMFLVPIGLGSSTNKYFYMNCMKCVDLHKKVMSPTPTPWKFPENIFARNLINIQICTEKSFMEPRSLGGRSEESPKKACHFGGKLPNIWFAWSSIKYPDLHREIMYRTLSPFGWWGKVNFQKCHLLGFEWNAKICTKNLCKKTLHAKGL